MKSKNLFFLIIIIVIFLKIRSDDNSENPESRKQIIMGWLSNLKCDNTNFTTIFNAKIYSETPIKSNFNYEVSFSDIEKNIHFIQCSVFINDTSIILPEDEEIINSSNNLNVAQSNIETPINVVENNTKKNNSNIPSELLSDINIRESTKTERIKTDKEGSIIYEEIIDENNSFLNNSIPHEKNESKELRINSTSLNVEDIDLNFIDSSNKSSISLNQQSIINIKNKSEINDSSFEILKSTIIGKTNITNSPSTRIIKSNKKVQKKKETHNITIIELKLKSKNKSNSKAIK